MDERGEDGVTYSGEALVGLEGRPKLWRKPGSFGSVRGTSVSGFLDRPILRMCR